MLFSDVGVVMKHYKSILNLIMLWSILAFFLLGSSHLSSAEVVLPTPWYDQDKYHVILGGNPARDTHGVNWYKDADRDGQHDPGEECSLILGDTTSEVDREGETGGTGANDGSFWLASAANLVQYMGGGDWYDYWAYLTGEMPLSQGLFIENQGSRSRLKHFHPVL